MKQINKKGDRVRKFRGTAHHKMDAKGRVSLPAKYRGILAGLDLVLVPGAEDCLWLYTDEEYQKVTKTLEENPFDEEYDLLRHLFIAEAEDIEVDSSGRIRVPARQREFASLLKEVTIVGTGPRLEFWNSDTYKERFSGVDRKSAVKILGKTGKAEQSS